MSSEKGLKSVNVRNINRHKRIRWPTACLALASGLVMLLVLFKGLSQAAPFQQNSLVSFEDVTDAAGVDMVIVQWGAEWGDYDGDGDQDLYVGNYFYTPNLYRNNGDGSFTDVRESAGLEPGIYDWHGSAWGDYNNDGALDLYVTAGRATNGSMLYTNNNENRKVRLIGYFILSPV